MKIAVIGSGISGLSAAYLLSQHHNVTLFEKNDYLGGHTRTVIARPAPGIEIPVDTGFIVFNYRNYPLLAQLFAELDVPVHKSDMSFGLTADDGWFEYGTPKPWNVLAQKRNLVRPQYWLMMRDVLRFFREAPAYMAGGAKYRSGISLGECLDEMQLGDWFRQYFILPMGAAIWSCPTATMLDFPADSFLRFFHNHGLLSVSGQPQWYTVTGGAGEYVTRLTGRYTDMFGGKIVRHGATRVERRDAGVFVTADNGARYAADQVVFACHADQALALIDDPAALARANRRFHTQIHLASHNRYLVQQLDLVHRSMALMATTSLAAEGRGQIALSEHEAIVAAIAAHDEDAAYAALKEHISVAFVTRLKQDAMGRGKTG